MKLHVKCDITVACKKILQEQLEKVGINHTFLSFGEVEVKDGIPDDQLKILNASLQEYGIEMVENHKNIIVQKIKDAIVELVYTDEKLTTSKISAYLSDKLGHSYGYISNLFSEVTYTSISNYIILQKIERAKQLILMNELTFSEIAWKLNYSSVAHFSGQFKSTTGITPSAFQRILNKRRKIQMEMQ